MTADEILRRLLEENEARVRGFEPQRVGAPAMPYAPPPMPQAEGEMQGPPAPPPDRRSHILNTLQRIAYGLIPAQTPLSRSPGTARAQMFLRGLAGGFQKSHIADMAQANRYGDEPGAGSYRGPNATGGGGGSLQDQLIQARIDEIRARMNRPDLDAERDIDAFVGREGRAAAITKARLGQIGQSEDAMRALAERRRRPETATSRGAGGSRKGGGGRKPTPAGLNAADSAQFRATAAAAIAALDPADPDYDAKKAQINEWLATQIASLARVRGERERGERPLLEPGSQRGQSGGGTNPGAKPDPDGIR